MKFLIRKHTGKYGSALLVAALLTGGCAREVTESADDVERTLLEAYVQVHHGAVQPAESGLYIIPGNVQGSGSAPVSGNYVYVNYTACDLDGNVLSARTNSDSVARQTGSFSSGTYYGPALWNIGNATLCEGLEEALKTMRAGERVQVLLPSWCSAVNGSRQFTTTTVFDIELLRVVPDIAAFQSDTLRTFSNRYHGGISAAKTDFYYAGPAAPGDALAEGDTLHVWYVGYLLDGFVFDTNIADSAAAHHIYSTSKTYGVLSLEWKESMGVVDGFKYALENMRTGDEAITFFSSDYGYKADGSGQIPAYAPLRFYLKVERVGRKTE